MAAAFAGKSAESRQRIYSVMTGFSIRSLVAMPVAAVLGLALAACSQTTYGTGKSPGQQTIEDIAGIAALGGGSDKEPIDYRARPKIVQPPPGAPLPPPGSEPDPTVAANWPKDPDVEAKKFKAETAARTAGSEADGPLAKYDPKFSLPKSQTASREPSPTLLNMDPRAASDAAHTTPDQVAAAKKLFADARGNIAVDENGKPIRRYLTDPPSDYREPDPDAPVEVDNKPAANSKKSGWKWPWE
jgi:hypothetical protein